MKRFLIAATIAALAVPMFTTHSAAHGRRWVHCRYGSQELGQTWTHHEVHETMRCAISHWPVAGGFTYADYIADRESGDGANALNPSSGTCGIFQSMPNLWPGRIRSFRDTTGWHADPSCFNARSIILWAIHYVHFHGWGPWGG